MKDVKDIKSFFKKYCMATCRFIERYVGNADDAADLGQDVFLKVCEKWGEFRTEDNARYFLYTTARNVSLNYLKHKRVESNFQTSAGQEDNEEEVFLEEVVRQETFRILYQAIDRLPPQTREVTLNSLRGATNQEISDRMRVSINTVKTLKKNAYQTLRSVLSKDYLMFCFFFLEDIF